MTDTLAFDGVDFDEPMEVGPEEAEPAGAEDESKPAAALATVKVKVEVKAEIPDPVLL